MATPDRRNFRALMALAPTMVGIAMKKENSAPAPRLTPSRMAPRMVEPEREVPGIRLRHWKRPMIRAVLYVMSNTFSTRFSFRRETVTPSFVETFSNFPRLFRFSTRIKAMP